MEDAVEQTIALEKLDEQYRELRLVRPAAVASIRESISRHGVLQPLVVNRTASDKLVLLDGFKRVDALRALKRLEAPARVLQIDDPAARAMVLTCNTTQQAGLSDLEEAWVVRSLVRTCGLRQTQVADLLGRHKSWVCRRLLLAEELAKSVQDELRLGLVAPSVAREVARLPRGNQDRVTQVVRDHGLTSRQAAEVVSRHLETEAGEALDTLLKDPLKYLTVAPPRTERPRDPRLSRSGDDVRRCLVRLDQALASTQQSLTRYPTKWLAAPDRAVLAPLAAESHHRCAAAMTRLTELAESMGSDTRDA